MAQAKPKFRAIIELEDGRQLIVFPRSKKTSLFTSAEKAIAALERQAARMKTARRGLVTQASATAGAAGEGDYWARTQTIAL